MGFVGYDTAMTKPIPLLQIIKPRFLLIGTALMLSACGPAEETVAVPSETPETHQSLRLATFNVAMGLPGAGDLATALQQGTDPQLLALAETVQRVRPDILVLNEFDYDPSTDAPGLLGENYLGVGQGGQQPITYPFNFRAEVNTGVDSGLDLNGNGKLGEPEDAWGFGRFPGQYGVLVLSRFPIDAQLSRTFQLFRWADLPGAHQPFNEDGNLYYPDAIWQQLRLSSKSHWDLPLEIDGKTLHLLVFHPTPPVFDGPEDRNGWRNFDEIRFWVEYLSPQTAGFMVDDQGNSGGLAMSERFVIAGDFNADPLDGDSIAGAVAQLLDHARVNSSCVPASEGGREAALQQGGLNQQQRGDPALDTADFNDEFTGNLRLDFLLPSADITVTGCGVFWPAEGQAGYELVAFSDHRLVWQDVEW